MENVYRTQDFNLASFLYACWLGYKRIEWWVDTKRCNFVFNVPDSISLPKLLLQWENDDTEFLRTLLYKNKKLKEKLLEFFNLQKLI